jgi:hypothetical protein
MKSTHVNPAQQMTVGQGIHAVKAAAAAANISSSSPTSAAAASAHLMEFLCQLSLLLMLAALLLGRPFGIADQTTSFAATTFIMTVTIIDQSCSPAIHFAS